MDCTIKYSSVILLTSLSIFQVNGADFRASPSTIIIGEQNSTTTMNITCIPNIPRTISVFTIAIGKNSQSGTESPIIQIDNINPNSVIIKDTSFQQRMSTSGSVSGSTGSLMMYLRDPKCEDAGSYYCSSTVNTASGFAIDEGAVNVTAHTDSATIKMTIDPNRVQFTVGEEVRFICSGSIGNQEGSMETLWNWQTLDTANFNQSWSTYPNTHNNITYEPRQSSGACQYTARSVLTHVVKSTDHGRAFRCFFHNEVHGSNKTLFIEPKQATATEDPVPSVAGGQEMSFSDGIAIGTGLMAVLVILWLIVVFIFRKKLRMWLAGTSSICNESTNDLSFQTIQPTERAAPFQENDSVYDVPEQRNEYADLQTETIVEDIPTTYRKIKNFQNA